MPDGKTGYIYSTLLAKESSGSAGMSETSERIAQLALDVVGDRDVIYGIDCYNSATSNGKLACAAVVSAILRKADFGYKQQILYCPTMQNYLDQIGFRTISGKSYQVGDVCFWTKKKGDRARHVGIIVQKDIYSQWWTVDNSSGSLRVLKRPLLRSYYPIVLPVKRVNI